MARYGCEIVLSTFFGENEWCVVWHTSSSISLVSCNFTDCRWTEVSGGRHPGDRCRGHAARRGRTASGRRIDPGCHPLSRSRERVWSFTRRNSCGSTLERAKCCSSGSVKPGRHPVGEVLRRPPRWPRARGRLGSCGLGGHRPRSLLCRAIGQKFACREIRAPTPSEHPNYPILKAW